MSSPQRHLVAFVRAPRIDRVKGRLARDVGSVAAWAFYRSTMSTVLRRLQSDPRWQCWLAITPDEDACNQALWPRGWRRRGQGRGDLGDRMARIMTALPPGPVVIVGSDIPDLAATHVADAFRALQAADAVFGPAPDGGYWLVGLRRSKSAPGLFKGVRWSTEHALTDTVSNVDALRVATLGQLQDIDTGEDLRRWQSRQSVEPS